MTKTPTEPKRSLLRRLLDARVIQTLAIYVPVAWVFTEIITAATPNFGLPAWVPGLAIVVLISGIPVVAFLAWAFQWTGDGIRTEVVSVRGGLIIAIALAALLGTGTVLFQRLEPPGSPMDATGNGKYGPVNTRPVTSVSVLEFDAPTDSGLGRVFASEISDRLARHADLFVTAPDSAYSVRLASMSSAQQQEVLLTEHGVIGSIEQEGDAYRLNVRLVGEDRQTVWEDDFRFGADAESQRGLQRRIGRQLAELLGTRTPTAEYCEPTGNLEALESYHAAKLLLNKRGPANLEEAERLLKHAIELDPDYGRAYSALAIATILQRKPENRGVPGDLSRKALDLCPTLAAAYKIWVPRYEGVNNWAIDQELQWQDALAMEPNHLWLLDNYSLFLVRIGRIEDAHRIDERSYRNNPLDPRAVVSYGWDLAHIGDFEQAGRLALRARELGDEGCNTPMLLLHVATRTATSEAETIEAYENLPERCRAEMLQGLEGFEIADLAGARLDTQKRRDLLDYMDENIDQNPNLAMIWGIELGDPDLAHRALEKGLASGRYIHQPAFWLREEGARQFRRDPRFVELMKQFELDEYWKEFGWPSWGMCAPLGDSFICDN